VKSVLPNRTKAARRYRVKVSTRCIHWQANI